MVLRGRAWVRRPLVLAIVAVVSTASTALAAPTCNDASGRTAGCGTAGAMPLGWQPAPQMLMVRPAAEPDGPSLTLKFGLACFLGGLLTLLVLLPDFEDDDGGGWDRQEDDDI